MTEAPEMIEPRNETVAMKVTATEKRAIQLVAALRNTSESEVMRTLTVGQIVAEADALREKANAAA